MPCKRFLTALLAGLAAGLLAPESARDARAQRRDVRERFFQQTVSESMPGDAPFIRYVKLRSELLSDFHGRPVYLRAGVLLPHGYDEDSGRRYPLWIRTGGFRSRYRFVRELGNPNRG